MHFPLKATLGRAVPGRLLRQAGQSLRERREKLFDDFVPYLLVVFTFWIVCTVEWTQKITGVRYGPGFWMSLSILLTIYGAFRAFRLYPRLRWLRLGERGEREVAAILDRLRAKGFVPIHDVPGEGFNIDHVVIGPTGIYAIETKWRSGQGTIEYHNGGELIFDGRIRESRPLRQARSNAYAVHEHLHATLGEKYWVKPLLVFVGDWRVQRRAGDFDVDVVTTDQLENYFDRQQPELVRRDIQRLATNLDQAARE